MSNFVFQASKGKVAYYASLPAAADSLIAVPIQSASVESDSGMAVRNTLADLLTGSTEQTTLGRKTMTSVTAARNDGLNIVTIDMADFTWTAGSGAPIACIVICYKPDTASTDSDIIPLTKQDFSVIPSGSDIPVQISSSGLITVASS